MRSIWFQALLTLVAQVSVAQDPGPFPDTLFFGPQVETTPMSGLADSLTLIHELREVDAELVVLQSTWYGNTYAFVITTPAGYEVLPIPASGSVHDMQASTADVRGNGELQVILRSRAYRGHTGWEHAIHEREWATQVWDLKERRCLLDLIHGWSVEEWTNTFAEDSVERPYDERTMLSSEGDMSCETYDALLTPGQLTLLRTDQCPTEEGGMDIEPKAADPIRYVLTPAGWVRR